MKKENFLNYKIMLAAALACSLAILAVIIYYVGKLLLIIENYLVN